MDVLKPEVYWLGNRCYRRNCAPRSGGEETSQYSSTYDQQGSYASDNRYHNSQFQPQNGQGSGDTEDMYSEEIEDSYEVRQFEDGFATQCQLPSSLYCHIVGAKAQTKNKLQQETGTRIIVPRPNEKGDIVIRGRNEKDVRNARRRVELIAAEARMKRDATHFACFPANMPSVVEKFQEFKAEVMKICGLSSRGLDESIFQKPEKLHFTLFTMVLLDERERNLVASQLDSMKQEIWALAANKPLSVKLKGLEIMNDDPSQTHVLYVKCECQDNRFQNIADMVTNRLSSTGFAKENRGTSVKLHCTLMNTRYRSKGESNLDENERSSQWSRREYFDATGILEKFGEYNFGTVDLDSIKICTRFTNDSTGFYKSFASVSLKCN